MVPLRAWILIELTRCFFFGGSDFDDVWSNPLFWVIGRVCKSIDRVLRRSSLIFAIVCLWKKWIVRNRWMFDIWHMKRIIITTFSSFWIIQFILEVDQKDKMPLTIQDQITMKKIHICQTMQYIQLSNFKMRISLHNFNKQTITTIWSTVFL